MTISHGVDRLSALIDRFRIRAHVACVEGATAKPNLYITTSADGRQGRPPLEALIFRPRDGGSLCASGRVAVAARVELGGEDSPLSLALPEEVRVELSRAPALAAVACVLRDELESPRCGRQAAVDRLCEVVVIRLLRYAMETGAASHGLIAGLSHPQIALALVAMHEAPERTWKLEDLAEVAGMSRTVFATNFRDVVGQTPGAYLAQWRLIVARQEIASGLPLKTVAGRVGFASAAAFTRAYQRAYGHPPRADRRPALEAAE
ncbi:helix-turn-helix transcriptional regulator [Rhizobiales bacterium]|uniref:helix-turn-helix transcriptional regulator n=1 Tax=Hongsoonwoonella zoysiae TaxID=2821844 RepID=UPI001560C5F1|nr:AraC family transcriptional regulator [Hongsoonwoonella zoysiae]NRG18060.1 helix-turn-helix transcriptional regulator [Hongsoonwoonella zoysiae]